MRIGGKVRPLLRSGPGAAAVTSRLVIVAVALGCISAAGMGGYLAVRTATETSAAAPAPVVEAAVAPPVSSGEAGSEDPAAIRMDAPAASATTSVEPSRPRATVPKAAPRSRTTRQATPVPAPQLVVARAEVPEEAITSLPAVPAPVSPAADDARATPIAAPPRFEDVELASNTVIGIRLDTTISSETSQVEDHVEAIVTRAVTVDGVVVIPTGARLTGFVTTVERGGKIRERSRVGIQFTSVALNDVRVPIRTEPIYRDGEAPGGEAAAKIGASAVVGSILGGVFGGRRGAVIGGTAGAAGGTAMVVAGDRNEARLPAGTALTVRLTRPAVFEIER